jgi:alpha-tubulin suppressor-like RCC1 family protein
MAGRIAAAQNFSFGIPVPMPCCHGVNANGQLGDGTKINHAAAVTAAGLSDAASVAAGFYHGLLVRNNGSVASWGYNGYGELGDGTSVDRITPITVPNLSNVVAAAAGRYHSASLRSDGTVWTWGYNPDISQ